jgi:hypothetical protein
MYSNVKALQGIADPGVLGRVFFEKAIKTPHIASHSHGALNQRMKRH